MKLFNLLLLFTVPIILLQSACAPVYVPNTRHTPLLDDKGEVHAAVHGGTNGADVQAAIAVSNSVGLVAAGSFGTNEGSGSLDADYHKHSYGELGLAYFKPFGKIGRFEALGGAGLGTAEAVNQYDFFGPQEVQATGNYRKYFVQGNLGVETGALEAGVALRLAQVVFTEFEASNVTHDQTESGTFFEPAAFARLGWKNIKLESQLGVSGLLQDEVAFDYETILFSLGIHFQFNAP